MYIELKDTPASACAEALGASLGKLINLQQNLNQLSE
jgi:uncharacterized membrane protein YqgA involved in biofilm formation